MGVDLAELGDALALLARPRITLRPEHRDVWVELMTGRDVILVDSLRAATGGLDENNSEIREPLDMLGGISDATGCRSVVIHHARKPSDDQPAGRYSIRGSGALYDACDCVYVFAADKGEPVSVEHEKAREEGETVDGFALTVADVADESGSDARAGLRVQVHGGELVRDRRAAQAKQARDAAVSRDVEVVRQALAERPGMGTKELREATGMNAPRFAAARRALGDEVEVRDERDGRYTTRRHFLRAGGVQ
jgi:AAA domain